jgi:hypothetical protein
MPNVTKAIMQRMLMEQAQQGQGGAVQPQGPQVDPQIDMIAKKMALLKGKPEDKYKIFIQLLPQILEAFGSKNAEGSSLDNYEVNDRLSQGYQGGTAMPPPQGSSEGRF